MAKVTNIEVQQKRTGRVSVYLDEKFWIGMDASLLFDTRLAVGDVLDEARVTEVERIVGQRKAMEAATHLLSYRERSEQELRDRLKRKGFEDPDIDAAIATLDDYQMIDDSRFAVAVIEGIVFKGKGRRHAEQELRRHAVSGDEISGLLDEHYPGEKEFEVALEWMRSRLRPGREGEQKALRQLTSRGFDFDCARDVISTLRSEGQ